MKLHPYLGKCTETFDISAVTASSTDNSGFARFGILFVCRRSHALAKRSTTISLFTDSISNNTLTKVPYDNNNQGG